MAYGGLFFTDEGCSENAVVPIQFTVAEIGVRVVFAETVEGRLQRFKVGVVAGDQNLSLRIRRQGRDEPISGQCTGKSHQAEKKNENR